ncbi:hypothetical protein [Lentzea sp. NPDC092896]|uniref:wHTH domain-containing protein n=1 Tax=Lentzea sp. NPDC092896 TaxID=3364127 RepID=UPI003816DA65
MQENDPRLVIGATALRRSLAEVTAPHRWTTAARDHLGPSNTMLGGVTAVVSHLAVQYEDTLGALAGDPWLDTEFADRFTRRLRWLTRQVLEQLRLSDAEAALLVVFPYLHQAFWAKAAVRQGVDPAVAAFTSSAGLTKFSTFAAGQGALHRRAVRAAETGDPAAAGIGWWMFHQWLVRQPECYALDTITSLLPESIPPPLNAVLTATRLMELMRAVQLDPAYLRRVDRPGTLRPVARIAGGTELEQDLREQLLGYLLVVAHRTAIDPTALPRVIADHIGIDDGITPDEVLTSIRQATWDGNRTRVLTTDCRHPATALALHDRAAAVDAVLAEIVRAAEDSDSLAPLKNMPVHASADGTTPAATPGHRFRLADDQIRALLMGEQLYGASELAIRELYQNALDACRYRQARTAYLTATGTPPPPWTGRIDFRQGVDELDRPFLECSDNGIGMGDRELVDVFAHAGVRFTDMPEYIEEQADWASAGVESFPNSRFGIGVLSYFMLADEITVTTCRLSRAGRPGRRLEVHIAGPDALFRVRDLGPGDEAGTVVRLRLRPADQPVRCTSLLRRILWVSDFAVTSDDLSGYQIWEPRQLSPTAPIGVDDALDPHGRRVAGNVVQAAGRVWWCDTLGAVLSDGLWAGTTTFGAVVDLSGHDQPRLTVNRQEIVELDSSAVEDLLRPAIPALLTSPGSPLSHAWLSELSETMPSLADKICARAIDVRYRPWRVGSVDAPIEVVGCFPSDANLFSDDRELYLHWNNEVSRWRLAVWLQVGTGRGPATEEVVPARPSDDSLLRTFLDRPSEANVLKVAQITQRAPSEVVARLVELGYPAPDPDSLPADVSEINPELLVDYDRRKVWLTADAGLSRGYVLDLAVHVGLAPSTLVERLAELGYDTSTVGPLPAVVRADDAELLAGGVMRGPLRSDETVSAAHVMVVAHETNRTPIEIVMRLAELGYDTPDIGTLPRRSDPQDGHTFIDQERPGRFYVRSPVSRRHIILTALETGREPAQIAARLAEAGLESASAEVLTESLTSFDHKITHKRRNDQDTLHRDVVVNIGHVVIAALETGASPVVVASRLTELGYKTPSPELLPATADPDDLALLSTAIRADAMTNSDESAWLRPGTRVSLQHVLIAAATTALSPRSVACRLAEYGFDTPPDHLLDLEPQLEDLLLLSVALNSKLPWLTGHHPALERSGLKVPLGHVLAAAARLGKSPAAVAARLETLGLRTEAVMWPDRVERHDSRLLMRPLKNESWRGRRSAEFGWIGLTEPADALHLLVTAGDTGLTPAEVAYRLSLLGVPVAESRGLPPSVDKLDLKLLSESLNGSAPYRDLNVEFPREDVMRAVFATHLMPREVFERLERLGIRVGE